MKVSTVVKRDGVQGVVIAENPYECLPTVKVMWRDGLMCRPIWENIDSLRVCADEGG